MLKEIAILIDLQNFWSGIIMFLLIFIPFLFLFCGISWLGNEKHKIFEQLRKKQKRICHFCKKEKELNHISSNEEYLYCDDCYSNNLFLDWLI